MRILLSCMGLLVLLGACGGESGKCAGPQVGDWAGYGSEDGQVSLLANCRFAYAGAAGCRSQGEYEEAPVGESGSVMVSIEAMSLPPQGDNTCLPVGEYKCSYVLIGDSLGLNCGGGSLHFSR